MNKFFLAAGATTFLGLASVTFAGSDKKEHCEKKGKDGSVEDIDAKTKEECKQKGGKWKKGHDDHKGHKDGDDHDHK